jgi:hypothetical protein
MTTSNENEGPRRPWGDEKETALKIWREENPGEPDPDDDALHAWCADNEHKEFKRLWRKAHPGQPLPDDYREIRRWANEQKNLIAAMARAMGAKIH